MFFNQPCAHIARDGLSVLKSQLHHLVLQIGRFRYIFIDLDIQSLVESITKHHLLTITDNSCFHLLSFFAPTFQKHGLSNSLHAMHFIYKSFDYLSLMQIFIRCLFQTCCYYLGQNFLP